MAALIDESKFRSIHHSRTGTFFKDPIKTPPDFSKHIVAGVQPFVRKLNTILAHYSTVLLKGHVAVGKTWSLQLVSFLTDNCLYFDLSRFEPLRGSEMTDKDYTARVAFMYRHLDAELEVAIRSKWSGIPKGATLQDIFALHLPENAVIFIDEAHIAFHLNAVTANLPSMTSIRGRLVYVSTTTLSRGMTGSAIPKGLVASTFSLEAEWALTEALCAEFVAAVQNRVGIVAEPQRLAKFLMCVTGGHRGMTVELLGVAVGKDSLNSCITAMDAHVRMCNGLQVRAASPNSYFDNVCNHFGDEARSIISALFSDGTVPYDRQNDAMRSLVTIGALVAVTDHRLSEGAEMQLANAWYARSVRSILPRHHLEIQVEAPRSTFDLLLYGLSCLDLTSLFTSARNTTPWFDRITSNPMPYELQIDDAITGGIHEATGSRSATGFSARRGIDEGQPDVVFGEHDEMVLEYVIQGNNEQHHYDRFDLFPAYDARDQLLVVFQGQTAPSLPRYRITKTDRNPAKVAVVSFGSTFWQVEVAFFVANAKALPLGKAPVKMVNGSDSYGDDGKKFVNGSNSQLWYDRELEWHPIFRMPVRVDYVPKQLHAVGDTFVLCSAQNVLFKPTFVGMAAKKPRLQRATTSEPEHGVIVTDGKVTFPVKPEKPQVMYLKAAIKPSWEPIEAATIVVKDPATGKVMGDKDPLHAGVEYLYELPPPSAAEVEQ